jgi:hypothetical protein
MTTRLPPRPPTRSRWHLFLLQALALVFAAGCAVTTPQAQTSAVAEAEDPPGRVGSITLLGGPVTLLDLASGDRETAALNWPVTAGWRLETGHSGRAEVRIGSTALRLDDDTTVDFARLDDRFMQIAVLRGSVALRLRNREVLTEIELLTQRERIVFDDIGRYRIDVDRVPGMTAVTALTGRARISSGSSSFAVGAGQRGDLTAPPMTRFQISAAAMDGFDDWVALRDARDDAIRSPAYVSREATGVEILDDYGDWRTVETYGAVWFPRVVTPGWAPYRYGRWAWVAPWGWTWIDEAPWGFAPFHYGRWVVVGGVWGWVPGVIVPRPIYAPALVAWFGGPGVHVSIGGPIGWFPLGPREVYVPHYRHTPRYLNVVNVQNGITNVTIVQTPRYVHHHPDRSTWVPGDRFGRPDPVQRVHRPPPSEWRQYVARPQPPANVPGTKRRQGGEVGQAPGGVAPEPARAPRLPPAQPAGPAPRIVETPRAQPVLPAPRAVEVPRTQPLPGPATRIEPTPRPQVESAPSERDDRRYAPRGAPPARPAEPSRQPIVPPATDRDDRRYAPRAPQVIEPQPRALPPVQPSAPRMPPPGERARAREHVPVPAMPPAAIEPGTPRGRSEHGIPTRSIGPAIEAPARNAPQAAPPVEPRERHARPEAPVRQPPPARQERGSDRGGDRPDGRPGREPSR